MQLQHLNILPSTIKEALLRKIFKGIKAKNYFLNESKYVDKTILQIEVIHIIEEFFIRNNNIEYLYTENYELPFSNSKKKDTDYQTMKYYAFACEHFHALTKEIDIFMNVHLKKDTYYISPDILNENKKIFLHSIEIVTKEAESIKETQPKLYKEIEQYLINFKISITTKDARQDKSSALQSYIKVLKDSKTNFTLKSKYGQKFFPIIVDIFLDYMHIMDILHSYDDILKNKRKRYQDFRNKLVNNNEEIDPTFYYLIKFSKKERVNNIKRYLLSFYLQEFKYNKNINILFRKLFLTNLKERKDYTPSNMNSYKTNTHLVFNILTNSKYFL